MSCFLEAMVLYAKINLTLSRHPDWDGYPSVKILYLIFLSVRQKLTAWTKKVGGSLECHLCIAGMYSYVLLRSTPDRFYQQSTVAEKYLDEDKKKLEMIKLPIRNGAFFHKVSCLWELWYIVFHMSAQHCNFTLWCLDSRPRLSPNAFLVVICSFGINI